MKTKSLKLRALYFSLAILIIALNAQAAVSLTVTSNPLWTDTGIMVGADQTISISATGQWCFADTSTGPPFTDAGGYYIIGTGFAPDITDEFVQNGYQGMLIGFVGNSPGSTGNWATGPYFAIGNASTFVTPTAGELWLGFNDDMLSNGIQDNAGSQFVTLTGDFTGGEVTAVPEPSCFGACAGMLLLASQRRRR